MITTHVLDTTAGRPAQGVPVRLESDGELLGEGVTDADGRCRELGPSQVPAGVYRLVFDTDAYFAGAGFFPEITVTFRITDTDRHHHVPVLLSPFSFTSYRGS